MDKITPITDDFVWRHINIMDWGKDFDTKRIKRHCLRNLDKETVAVIRKKVSKCMAELEDAHGPGIRGVSDDSWSDVRAHIIGLGMASFVFALQDREYVQRIIDDGSYVESFLYALPYDDDWTALKRAPERAQALLEDLENLDEQPTGSDALILDNVILRLSMIVKGEFGLAVHGWNKELYKMWNGHIGNHMYSPPNLINEVQEHISED